MIHHRSRFVEARDRRKTRARWARSTHADRSRGGAGEGERKKQLFHDDSKHHVYKNEIGITRTTDVNLGTAVSRRVCVRVCVCPVCASRRPRVPGTTCVAARVIARGRRVNHISPYLRRARTVN